MSGLKPKSRWYFRSELETSPSSSTHSTSDVVRTTVVAVVPADMTPNPNLNMNNNCLDENSTKTPTDGDATFYAPPPPPLPPFELITENIYFDKSKKGQRSNRMICECSYDEAVQSGYGCRDECLNRVLYYECGSNCPCSSLCSNRRFQNRQYSYVEPFPAGDKGYGLRAVNAIPANSFIIEYVGEVLTPNQFEHRKKQYAKDTTHKHHYFMALKSDQVIDATRKGNVSRFINHSCDPNCQTQKWAVCGQLRIGFFTIKNVQAGEELTFDYRFQRYGKEAQRCYCGSVSCRGFIGVDGKERKNNIEKEEKRKEKTVFEDALFDREFEDMIALGSLKNKDQVVTFGRLVLRAEGFDSRRQLLDLLTNTEKHVLRLFLDLHGCRLLWSWAVDEAGCGENFRNLQTKLLEILKILPIPHQNMLRESRILSVVERWANGGCRKLPISAKSSNPTNSDEDIFDCVKKTLIDLVDRVCSPFSSSPAESEVAASFDIDSKGSLCYENNISTENVDEIVSKSLALLQQWSLLKENFKIPKRSGEKEEKSPHDKKSANLSSTTSVLNKSKGSSSDLKKSVISETKKHLPIKSVADSGRSSNRRDRHNNKSRSRSRSRSRDKYTSSSSSYHHRSSAYGRYRNSKPSQSPPPYHRNNSRFDISHRKRPSSPSGGDTKRSKEERRRAFEESVAREDERKQMKEFSDTFNAAAEDVAVQQQQQQQNHQTPYWDHSGVGSTPMSSSTIYDPNSSSMAVPPTPVPVPPPTAAQAALPAVLVHDHVSSKYWWRDQSTGILVYPASDQQVASVENHDLSVVPHFLHDASTGYIHEIQMPVQEPAPSAYAAQDDRNEVDMVCEDDSMTRDQRINLLREQIATLQSQMDQKQKELQWLLEQEETTSSPVRSPPSRPPSRLPPDWKTALDPNGKVYYYHSITKKTQWEPPSWVEPLSPALSPKKSKSPLPKQQQQRDRRSSSSHAKSSSRAKPTMTSSSSSRDHHRRRRSSSHHRSSSSHHRHQQNSSRSNAAPSGSGGSGKDRGEQQRKMKAALKIKNAAFPKKSSIKTTSAQVQKMAAKSKAVEKEKLQKKIIEQQLKLLLQQHQPVAAAAVEASTSSFAMKTTPPPATVTSMPHFVPIPALVKEEPIADEQSSFEVTPFGTTTAAADTSSEVARKFKESFKTSVSNYVIKCLSSYRKTECKLGRITNNEDFKHLARKLTHAIMEKELKHCRGLEDLRVTDSVLHKAKAYIKHYMAKLGAVYKRTVGGSP